MTNLPIGTVGPLDPVAPIEPPTPVFFDSPQPKPVDAPVTGNKRLAQESKILAAAS